MIPGIEGLYERIAKGITAEIPEDWKWAKLVGIFYSDSITWEPEFETISGKLKYFDVSLDVTRAFRELRRKFKEMDQPVWGQASFELMPDGKFKLKWGYENCDANGDTIWDEVEWRRRQDERHARLME